MPKRKNLYTKEIMLGVGRMWMDPSKSAPQIAKELGIDTTGVRYVVKLLRKEGVPLPDKKRLWGVAGQKAALKEAAKELTRELRPGNLAKDTAKDLKSELKIHQPFEPKRNILDHF